jgi:hypothetical protein
MLRERRYKYPAPSAKKIATAHISCSMNRTMDVDINKAARAITATIA